MYRAQVTSRQVVWSVAIGGGAAIVVILSILCFALVSYLPSKVYRFAADEALQLTEETAISCSRQALVQEYPRATQMWPWPLEFAGDKEVGGNRYFATSDNKKGYVMWTVSQRGGVKLYTVRIEKMNGEVTCCVYAYK